jgi:hypothetical protein
MKKIIFILVLLSSTIYLFAQDLIIRTNGDKIKCSITKVDSLNVYFVFERNGEKFSTSISKNEIQDIQYIYNALLNLT